MSLNQRVFITGVSALTAAGATAEATWQSLCAGEGHLRPITSPDLSSWGEVIGGQLADFQPAKMLPDRKLIKVISQHDVMGIHAAMKAIEHSQLLSYRDTLASTERFNELTGVYVGSPGNKYFQQYDFLPLIAKSGDNMQAFANDLFADVHPMWLLRILPNNVLAYTGITYGFKGPNHNVTNHAVGGTQALIEACHAIASGQIERAVVIAYDVGTEPQALYYYDKLGVMSRQHLKPFDEAHDGTVFADGAAALVLESEASAMQRGATCFAEMIGGMSASEASGLFNIEEDGRSLAKLIQKTLAFNHLNPQDIEYVVAHGNGNPKSDRTEAEAIAAVWGQSNVPVTAFKWAMGHTLTASGLVDAVLTSYALNKRCIPGIANLDTVASECSALNLSSQQRAIENPRACALLINRGFAGMNTCFVMKACG